jgi:hypothetical protein
MEGSPSWTPCGAPLTRYFPSVCALMHGDRPSCSTPSYLLEACLVLSITLQDVCAKATPFPHSSSGPATKRMMRVHVVVQACELQNCDVYSYRTDRPEADPFDDQSSIWAFNYFFYNRKLKRIVYFSCRSMRKSTAAGDSVSTPEASLRTSDTQKDTEQIDSDSEIIGGMDDMS